MSFGPTRVALGSATYDECYPNILIGGQHHETDDVLLAAMRFLLTDERLKKASNIGRNVHVLAIPAIVAEKLGEKNEEQLKEWYTSCETFKRARYGIYVHTVTGDDAERASKEIRNYVGELSGFRFVEDLSLYLDKTGTVSVFQNTDRRLTCVFTTKALQIDVMHKAASALPRIFPWCFKDECKLTDAETAVLKALAEDRPAEFITACDAVIATADYRGKRIASMLNKFCRTDLPNQISCMQENIKRRERDIESYLEQIRAYNSDIENYNIQLIALRNKEARGDKDDNELLEYLRTNNEVYLLNRSGGSLYYAVTSYLDTYDDDMFEAYIVGNENDASYVYRKSRYSFDITKKLFLAIWKEGRFRVRTYCKWKINTDCGVNSVGGDNLSDFPDLTANRIPQPHIHYHNCYSGYRNMLSDAQDRRDYVGAVAITVQSSHSINWSDSTVVSEFMSDFFCNYKDVKFLEDAEGNLYTPAEAIAILKKEGK